jgi:YidC/Oxa1 family membrane protein insertase
MGDMEKRLLLFFGVTFLLVSLWPRIFPAPAPREPAPSVAGEPDVASERVAPPPSASASEAAGADEPRSARTESRSVDAAESAAVRAAQSEQAIVVETPLYRMELTNRGARMVSFELSHHLDAKNQPYQMVGQIAAEQLDIRPLDVRLEDSRQTAAVREALFELKGPSQVTVADGEEKRVELLWSDGRGLEVDKRVTVHGDDFRLGVEISVRDQGREIAKSVLFGAGIGNEIADSRYIAADKGVIVSRGEVELFTDSAIEEGEGSGVGVSATGVASHYFAALMLPTNVGTYGARLEKNTIVVEEARDPKPGQGRDSEGAPPARSPRDVITAVLEVQATPAELTLYIGPKRFERLQALAPGMEDLIELGWMRYPALLLRSGLMAIYDRVGNYGWAIVLLTVLINILLLPLKHYSFVSMRKMQKIAPQTQKIRERYKKVKPTDPRYQEMNQEIMALHKQAGVNPLSGCLPMLLMIPFFFAFYQLLMTSIELRHAPFVFWIQDLSVFDPLYALPILMGATQVVIQKMTPQTSADPIQGKIMAFMPVMFTLILLWAPAGLVLYWFSNNLVSMVQQSATNRLLADRDEAQAEAEKAAGAVKSVKTGKKRKAKKA